VENHAGIVKSHNQEIACQVGLAMVTVLKMVGKLALAILIVLGVAIIMSAKIATSFTGSKG